MMGKEEIVEEAFRSLGKGFDLTSDFRLKFCKGEERMVVLNETERRDVRVPGFGTIKDVSVDIKCDKGDRTRYQSDILTFTQMSELFNQKSSIHGKIPSGYFNRVFGFDEASWASDAANTKNLGLDGYFIILFNVHIDRYPLQLSKQVIQHLPSSWDPPALARFIEKYGTHILVGLSIGGKDLVLVKQDVSSNLGPSDLRKNLDDLGDQLFTGTCNFLPKTKDHKNKAPQAFDVFGPKVVAFNSSTWVCAKDGITVICSKRGGDTQVSNHCEWLLTVPEKPDAVHFNFIPITSLLKGAPGRGFLSHAINLYLRYKPPMSDLPYFLDFQAHKLWAPIHNDLPLGPLTNRTNPSPSLTFNLMGPKLYVNTAKVTVGKRPITGMRLFLEGIKCNRLAIHLQHLLNTPIMFDGKIEDTTIWSEEVNDDRFFEAVNSKKFSHVCTAPVKYNTRWRTENEDVAFIVTGAQLHVKKHDSVRNVLHLRLLFSKVSNSVVVKSNWTQGSSGLSQKSGIFSAISTSIISGSNKDHKKPASVVVDSSVFPTGPPVPVQTNKLLKFVDLSQLCKGPQDSPGHWLVTGARLVLDKGKIRLWVKFSLLNTGE
ncbi:MACPF domain-containing protein At1g14780 isoform X3 [Arachis ipaensis]|uniref:MACPF domain-containing protein At1g14780 isoform X2 n=1 Tax=Arachis ipaensis TaxID=130454 RepID=UPI0007AF93D7|nr:MACPF domain-containing protein At1g14780 isoform X2 [Arachis ipaensis]XP_020975421.1 MACPF domain-containing protein At1g14780 isoform X3 [Arachis ipaensis]